MPTLLIYNKRSTSLFEVVVATVIFSLVMAGMASVFVSSKRYVLRARDRITSSEMGKLFLEPLQLAVRADSWDSGFLACGELGLGSHSCGASSVNTIPYTVQYQVDNIPGVSLRRVTAKVSWTELSP
ncbi:MAG: hypothetical protein Q7J37_05550 [Candidatus Omnitrophota bacterium]|nr:hypothetical protein [Candidatus Omnitrophota bacterium]